MLRQLDWWLILIVVAILIYGLIALTSTTSSIPPREGMTFVEFLGTLDYSYALLQLMFFGIGVLAVAVILLLDYNNLRDYIDWIFWGSIALLVAVTVFGDETKGVSGWFYIAGRGFQPSEFCKVSILVVLAKYMSDYTEGTGGIKQFRQILPILWRFLLPVVIIIWQNDYGTSFVYMFMFAGMLFMARTDWKILLSMAAAFAALIPIAWLWLLSDWQRDRVLDFFDPTRDPTGTGMQAERAKVVAGSGGVEGKGYFSEDLLTQQNNYLPEEHTDMIFSANTEAGGFWGALLLLTLYLLLIIRMIILATRAKDDFGSLMIIGVACIFIFHVFQNVGMNIGVMPISGIPLPLFSYGGSNMLTVMMAIGVVLNVNMRRQRTSV